MLDGRSGENSWVDEEKGDELEIWIQVWEFIYKTEKIIDCNNEEHHGEGLLSFERAEFVVQTKGTIPRSKSEGLFNRSMIAKAGQPDGG